MFKTQAILQTHHTMCGLEWEKIDELNTVEVILSSVIGTISSFNKNPDKQEIITKHTL